MESEPVISVIIPVYNVKDYLSRCVDSVLSQTYHNLEIWIVDDGSTDGSDRICDEYAEKDDRIKVIHKENGGLSEARNLALDKMSGRFIIFVDSDDYIHSKMIDRLYQYITKYDADIAACRQRQGKENTFNKTSNEMVKSIKIFEGDEIFESVFDDKYRNTIIPAWAKLYKATLFSMLRYPVGKIHEDEFVIHHILSKCNRMVLIEEELYYQYERNGSITRNGYSLTSLDAVEAIDERCEFFEKMGNSRLILMAYKDYLRRVQFHYYSLEKYYPEDKKDLIEIKNNYKKRYEAVKSKMEQKTRIRYGLFLWVPNVNRILKSLMGARAI